MKLARIVSPFSVAVSVLLVAFLSGCSGGSNPGPSDAAKAGGTEPAAISGKGETCDQFIAKLPPNYFYDWVTVPENYLDPANSAKIRVFYYGPRGTFDSHVVFFNGGPGYDSHYNYRNFDKSFADFGLPANKVGFIYIDQRGTGCSANYPEITQDSDLLKDRFYGSTGIVYDAEAVRTKLYGNAKWKVFGQSYGAFIVHRYVTLFPDSVSDAYAHANTLTSDPVERLAGRMYSQYDVTQKYLTQFPDDLLRLTTLRTYLITQPKLCLSNPTGVRFCGTRISSLLISRLGFSDKWPKVHSRLANLVTATSISDATVDPKALQTFVDIYSEPAQAMPASFDAAMEVIGFYDRNTLGLTTDACTAAMARVESEFHVKASDFLVSECSGALQYHSSPKRQLEIEAYLQTNAVPATDHLELPKFIEGLRRLGLGHFYLYSGERDMFVPKENFTEELAATQGLLTYQHFPNSGHEGFFTELAVLKDLLK